MIRNFMTSTAAFSPPDDGGSSGGDVTEVVDTGGGDTGGDDAGGGDTGGNEVPADAAPGVQAAQTSKDDHSKPRVETISDSIKRAVNETNEKANAAAAAAKAGKKGGKDTTQAGGAKPGDTAAKPSSETTTDGNTGTAPQAASAPPKAWSKEEKALWNDLPEAARAAITRREADTEKGVQELRTRYQDIDSAVAPYKAVMTQNNVTPAQAITQLFKWHMELAGPNKIQAYVQLGKSFGIDPATVAAALATQQTEKPADADQGNPIPENLRPVISGLETRIKSFEEQNALAVQNAAKQTWINWSKDKPYAEKVRGLMANLINSDLALIQAGQPQISNTINPQSMSIDMDAAYQAAVYAHPEVRATLIQEEQAKREREAKAAAEKARKAGTGMRSGAPAAPVGNSQSNAPKVETVAESIRRALAEVRGTQH